MARRPLLTDEEHQLLFGVPGDPDALARHYIFTRSDQDLVVGRRGAANRLGFAVQLEEPIDALVEWLTFSEARSDLRQITTEIRQSRDVHKGTDR